MKEHEKKKLDRKQKFIAAVIVFGAIVSILGAWYLVQREASTARFEPAPLRAQPGTEREQRLEVEPTAPAPASTAQGESGPASVPVDAPPPEESSPADEATPPAEAADTPDPPALEPEPEPTGSAMAAGWQGDPATGLARLLEALTTAPLAEASTLYSAAGILHLQGATPDEDAAQAAFERALAVAQTSMQAKDAAYHLAELLVHRGESEQALVTLSRTLPVDAPPPAAPSRATVRLRLFQGGLFEQSGDHATARACYEQARHQAREVYLTAGDDDAALVYRQASLALSRHQRSRGETEAAEATLADLRATLGEAR